MELIIYFYVNHPLVSISDQEVIETEQILVV
jgi:hypothetical protein